MQHSVSMIEEEMEKCISDQNQDDESGYDTVVQHVTKRTQESKAYKEMMHSLKNVMMIVVESMINKFEEDEIRNQERQRRIQKEKSLSYCTDNCSDSDSSFNQSYKFCPGKLRLILDQLDPGQPKEVRYEALQTLCSAPPSDVLNCENWTSLCDKLKVALSDPDPVFSVRQCLQKLFKIISVSHHPRSKWNMIVFFNSSSNICRTSLLAFQLSKFSSKELAIS